MNSSALSRRGAMLGAVSAASIVIAPSTVLAQASTGKASKPASADHKILRDTVEKLFGAKVEAIGPAPLPGLVEVIVNGNVYYIDSAGKHLIEGHIVDIGSRSSLTAQRKLEFERTNAPVFDVASMNFEDAIKLVYGKPTPGRVLVAFEDPRCGFCKKLHQDLQGVKDLVVYTFPVAFLGPQSREMNEGIWCASDRAQAWKAVMAGQGAPASKGCDFAALDRNMEVARKLRVTGTPTMFTASGQRIVGAVGLEAIEQALRAAS